jgi:hypothetical protein|tara:strand:- start:909 stop:1064 length:156 start_codon:yes stop_codon:yes gene_type:complete
MRLSESSKYPPWSRKRKDELKKMPIQTSVAIPGDKNIIEKAFDSIRQFFKK